MWIQFFRLCRDLHNRNYAQLSIMRSTVARRPGGHGSIEVSELWHCA